MKKLLLLAIALNVVLHPFRAGASVIRFEALLTGDQEVPAVSTDASGMAILLLDDVQNRLEIFVQLFGLDLRRQTPDSDDDVRGMHIHRAPFGFDGPIVFGFIDPNSDLNGDLLIDPSPPCGAFLFPCGTVFSGWDMNEGLETTLVEELPFLFADSLYINVHTPGNPDGEVRGQIRLVSEPGTLLLMVLGLGALAWRRIARQKRDHVEIEQQQTPSFL